MAERIEDESRYKLRIGESGSEFGALGISQALIEQLRGLGYLSIGQVYAACKAVPEAVSEMVRGDGVDFDEFFARVESYLHVEEQHRIDDQ